MACLNMFNNEQQHQGLYNTSMSTPRISFSNDFGDPKQPINSYREAPVSSDFAFAVPSYSMISADEVFFKGKMLPLRENCGRTTTTTTTLKDELLAGDDDDQCNDLDVAAARFGKGIGIGIGIAITGWKERLGIKRPSFVVSKKCDNKGGDGSLETVEENKSQEDTVCQL